MTMSYRIEDVLESVQEGAPTARTSTADIIAGARRIQNRRRLIAGAAGASGVAIATIAVIVGVTGALPHAQTPSPPAAATPSAKAVPKAYTQPKGLEFTVGESRTGAFRLGPVRTVSYGHQEVPVYRDGKTIDIDGIAYPVDDGAITLYRPGIYDIKRFGVSETPAEKYGSPKDVIIDGRPGVERSYSYDLPNLADFRAKLKTNQRLKPNDPSVKTDHYVRTALAWKYDGSAWATFLPSSGREPMSREDSLAIVAALRPQPAEPVRAPYTFGWLPAGLRVIAAQQSAADDSDIVSTVTIDKNGPTGKELVYPESFYPAGGNLSIFQGRPKPENAPAQGQAMKCFDVNGYCTMVIDDKYTAEFQKIGKALSMDDVRHILRELRFTDLDDQGVWKPITD
jgi:hypothetical protein